MSLKQIVITDFYRCINKFKKGYQSDLKLLSMRMIIYLQILKEKILCEDVDWVQLAQDRGQCQAFVNIVINLFVP
jgi:hypothetical protein